MSGNWAIGRVLIPSTPRNKRMIEMTIANAGRWRIFVNMTLYPAGFNASHSWALFKTSHDLADFGHQQ